MGKIANLRHKKYSLSLKWAFVKYIIPCVLLCIIGILVIGYGTNYLQEWYAAHHETVPDDPKAEIEFVDGTPYYHFRPFLTRQETLMYWLISNAQFVLMPLWGLFCGGFVGVLFYRFELKEPIGRLMEASRNIAENQLDFQIQYKKQNELGMLCKAFDDMRLTLYENNRDMWKSLEERKRLNSAFSHDLRTPLTVLKGYVEFLQRYVPDNKVPEKKLLGVLSMMNEQITRLEHYTQKMNAVQKLEDIVPDIRPVRIDTLTDSFRETGALLCSDKQFTFRFSSGTEADMLLLDTELVMQVYENLISNAVRYADSTVCVTCTVSENRLEIAVSDDGSGFTETALRNAAEPFFRDEKGSSVHFGLGLYICRILCQKCSGSLSVDNSPDGGGLTTASFAGDSALSAKNAPS